MHKLTYDLQGYTINLNHVLMLTPIFTAKDDEGYQFNIRLLDLKMSFKFPTRQDATMQRELLVKAINNTAPPDHQQA